MLRKVIFVALSLSAIGASSAMAQTPSLNANYGQINLSAGFQPDPFTVSVVAGGSISASNLGANCAGYVTDAPDYKLNYTAGSYPLIISALSDADTTIVINDPYGNWFCDDDSGEGLNPLVTFGSPLSGRYDIWIGTFSSGQGQSATLRISEIAASSVPANPVTSGPDISATPTYGSVALNTGFQPDPYVVNLLSGGNIDASTLGNGCRGFIARAPDFSLTYTAGTTFPLIISVAAGTDTTLVINDAHGNWVCDDDGGNAGLNPSVRFSVPQTGRYDIWVGTYGGTNTESAQLFISELTTQ